jgi:hypothetical protein
VGRAPESRARILLKERPGGSRRLDPAFRLYFARRQSTVMPPLIRLKFPLLGLERVLSAGVIDVSPQNLALLTEPLSKNPSTAMLDLAHETPGQHSETDFTARAWQIRHVRAYLLCTRRDADPHNGHVAMLAFDLATNNIESDETLTLSATNPLGTRDEF